MNRLLCLVLLIAPQLLVAANGRDPVVQPPIERLHLLIPGAAGGGWDAAARGVGQALVESALLPRVSYANISGGNQGRAITQLLELGQREANRGVVTLMVSSTPIIIKALRGTAPYSYRDLQPIASVMADYGAFVVAKRSPIQDWTQVMVEYGLDPRRVKVAGGSVRGGMDHLVVALALHRSGLDAKQVRYIPYDTGGKAMVGLLSGETQLLSTGLSEAVALAAQGEVRILAVTAPARVSNAAAIPTLREQGIDMTFANWRGLFAAPDISQVQSQATVELLQRMAVTPQWRAIRDRRAWSDLLLADQAFVGFLESQERRIAEIMQEIGMPVVLAND